MSRAPARSTRFLRPVGALTAGLALALVPLAAGTAPADAAPASTSTPSSADPADESAKAEVDADAVTLRLTDLSPAVTLPTDTIVLTGEITNSTDEPFVDPTLRLSVQQAVPSSREAMERWFDVVDGPRGRTVITEPYLVSVPPGESVPFSFTVPVTAQELFPIRTDNWGARGLEISLSSGSEAALARTVGVFHPGEEVPQPNVQIGVLLPLTPSASEWSEAATSGAPVGEVSEARIRDLVTATGDDVTWALDPALLVEPDDAVDADADAEPTETPEPTETTEPSEPSETTDPAVDGGAEPDPSESTDAPGESAAPADPSGSASPADPVDQPSPTESTDPGDPADPADPTDPAAPTDPADPNAPDPEADPAPLTDDLVAAAGDRHVIALPWADADIPALAGAAAEGQALLTDARVAALEVFAAVGLQVDTTTAWPAAPGVSEAALEAAADAEYASVVIDGAAAPEDGLAVTPSARTQAAGLPAAVSDAPLSGAVSGDVPEGSTTTSPQLASRQHALALSAVIAQESSDARSVLVTIDRTAAGEIGVDDDDDPGAADLGARVQSLLAAPWVTPVGVRDVLAAETSAGARAAIPATDDVTSSAFVRTVEAIRTDTDLAEQLRSALARPEGLDLVGELLATTTSSAWRLAGEDPSAAVAMAEAELARYSGAVTVSVPASLVDVFAEESAVPLTLTNTLDQAVTVDVVATPDEPALRVEAVPAVTIEPGADLRVLVPMVAVANGRIAVDVDVLSPDGAPVGPGQTFDLRVRAEWETVGTGIVAAVMGVLLIVGLVRTFRRGRRRSDGTVPGTEPEETTPPTTTTTTTEATP